MNLNWGPLNHREPDDETDAIPQSHQEQIFKIEFVQNYLEV